jgi:hypothetical protein
MDVDHHGRDIPLQKQPSTAIGCKSPALRHRRKIVLNVATAKPAAI